MSNIIHPRFEYRANPLGIDITQPRLSWQMQTDRQAAYRIRAASSPDLLSGDQADLWDSGKVESDQSVHVPYAGTSRQRVYWQVRVWDDTGEAVEGAVAWFEMGLLDCNGWQAQPIGADLIGGPRSTTPAPYRRKPLSLASAVHGLPAGRYEFVVG